MLHEDVAEPLDHRRGKVSAQIALEVRVVRERRRPDRLLEASLRVREQNAELGPRHSAPGPLPLAHLLGRRKALDLAVEQSLGFELEHEVAVRLQPLMGDRLLLREDLRLQVVVVEDVRGDVGLDLPEQVVPLLGRQIAVRDGNPEQDLQVDLMVRAVDPGGVVDRVGVDLAAALGVLDPGLLREAEVAALGDDACSQLVGAHADRVVHPVADGGVGLVRGLDERADAPVPEEVDRRSQDCAQHLVRRQRARASRCRERPAPAEAARSPSRSAPIRRRPRRSGSGRSRPRRSREGRTAVSAPSTRSPGQGRGRRRHGDGRMRPRAGSDPCRASRCRTRRRTCRRCRRR